jgi:hypothetical protein
MAPWWLGPRWTTLTWAAGGLLWLLLLRNRRGSKSVQSSPPQVGGLWSRGAVVAAALFAAPPLLHALAPATALDSVVYHLTVPKQYLMAGRAFEMPWSLHSYFPRLGSMLFAQTLHLDASGSLAQLTILGLAACGLAALVRLGGRLFGDDSGAWGGLLLLTMPALNLVAGWAYADWAMLSFAVLAFDRLYRHLELGRRRDLLLAGLLLGGALG